MVLHIHLDSKKKLETTNKDIVLVNGNNCCFIGKGTAKVVNYGLVNENDSLYKQIKEWYKLIGSKGQIDNSAYNSFFRHIFAIIYTIDEIIENNNIEEIYLYGGGRHIYCTSVHAEGEGNKKNYETNWLVNAIIEKRYAKTCRIVWIDRRPTVFLYLHHWVRYCKSLLLTLAVAVRKRKLGTDEKCKKEKIQYLSIVDLPLQYRHLSSLFSTIESKSCVFFTFDPTLSDSAKDVYYLPKLGLWQVLKIYFCSWAVFKRLQIPLLGYHSSFLRRELRFLYIQYQLRLCRQKNYLEGLNINKNATLVTNMTFGMDVVSCHELAKHLQWRHLNMQYVAMARILYPNLELADDFYLFSRRTYDLYSAYSNSYKYYLPLRNKQTSGVKKTGQVVLTIFMQPDSFVYDYFDYLRNLLPLVDSKRVKIVIKPHYRQNLMDELYEIVKPYSFVSVAGLHDSCEDLLRATDIALSIYSSVVFEALLNNVMCLVYNPEGKYDDLIYYNDICYPEVNFVISTPQETIDYIENCEYYKKQYVERRMTFVQNNHCELSLEEIL